MERAGPLRARLLVVVRHYALREALLSLLTEESYIPTGVSSLEDALAALEQQPYALLLTDLFAGISRHSFTPAHILRRHAQSTPVGLLTAQSSVLESPALAGFAFALPTPVGASLLLTEIAASLQRPLSRRQQRQAARIERFLKAWGVQAWASLLRQCTEDVICYPAALFPQASSEPVQGKLALLALVNSFRGRYHSLRLEAHGIFPLPYGLAIHYGGCAAEFGQDWEFLSGVALFWFEDERIFQIGRPLSALQQRGLLALPAASLEQRHSS